MGGAITGNGERAEEENEGDPPHLRPLPSAYVCEQVLAT